MAAFEGVRYPPGSVAGVARGGGDLLGTPEEHKRLIRYDTDHVAPKTDYVEETLAWLDRYLGPAANRGAVDDR